MKIWPGASIDWCFLSTTVVSQPEARLEFAYRRLVCKKGGGLLGCHVRFIEGRLAIYYDTHTRVLDGTLTSVTGEINGPREEACCGSRGRGGGLSCPFTQGMPPCGCLESTMIMEEIHAPNSSSSMS